MPRSNATVFIPKTAHLEKIMSSHHEWVDLVIAEHNSDKPFAPENGQALAFKPGDQVVFTNDYGVSFDLCVTGFYAPQPIDALYASGRRYILNSDSPWMPVPEASLAPR